MIFRTPRLLPWIYPELTWRVTTTQKEIYLTFDDGPVPGPTEFVLETLAQHQAKATFFCIGDNVRKHPQIFTKLVQAGHSVGNHTFNHLPGWRYSTAEYIDNIARCQREFILHQVTPAPIFRPPYGRISFSQIRALKGDYRIIMWDVLTRDYTRSLTPERCLAGTIQATRSGSIVVFHDSLKAERSLRYVLPRYLQYLRDEGYAFGSF